MSDGDIEAFIVVANLLEDSFKNKSLHKEYVKYAESCSDFYRSLEKPWSWKEFNLKLNSVSFGNQKIDALTPWGALATLSSENMICDDLELVNKISIKLFPSFEKLTACDFAMSFNLGYNVADLSSSVIDEKNHILKRLSETLISYEVNTFGAVDAISRAILPVTIHMMLDKIGIDRTILMLKKLFSTPFSGSYSASGFLETGRSLQTYSLFDFEETWDKQTLNTSLTFEHILGLIDSIAEDTEEVFPLDWHLAVIL